MKTTRGHVFLPQQCLSLGCQQFEVSTASDSGLAAILKKMETLDVTKMNGILVMLMDKEAMVKMVKSDGGRSFTTSDVGLYSRSS